MYTVLLSAFFLVASTHTAVKPLSEADLKSENTFLIYFHDTRDNYTCSVCEHFSEAITKIHKIDVRDVNYFTNEEMAVRFFVYYVPYFLVRSRRRTYAIFPQDSQELVRIIETESWKSLEPLKWYFDPDCVFVRIIANVLLTAHTLHEYAQMVLGHVPKYVLYTAYGMVFGYLAFSIKGAIVEIIKETKSKRD